MNTLLLRFLASLTFVITTVVSFSVVAQEFSVTADDVTATTTQETAVSIELSGSTTGEGPIVFSIVDTPSHGTLESIVDSAVLYTPESDFIGQDSFTYLAEDGSATTTPATSSPATVTIDVTEAEEPEKERLLIETDVMLANGCEVTDADGITHHFPEDSSPSDFLGICALVAAQEAESIESFEVINHPSFGLFVDSVNGIRGDGAFWALWRNDEFADCGIGCLALAQDDTLSLIFTTFEGEAGDSIILHIIALDETYANVVVPNGCEVEASDSAPPHATSTHAFPKEGSPSEFLGICAFVALKETGGIEEFTFVDFGFGLFLDSINDVATTEDFSSFWMLSLNGESASVGIADLAVEVGDEILLEYAPAEEETLRIGMRVVGLTELPGEEEGEPKEETPQPTGGGGGSGAIVLTFNVPAALAYLANLQDSDGSFDESFLTDWIAVAFGSAGAGSAQDALRQYLLSNSLALSSVTDYQRHAMALMALGINPYSGTATDYVSPIVAAFDGTQIGSASLVNDDIFALFPLPNAGYTAGDVIIKKTIEFILGKQLANGSWEGSVDLTAAAIQALTPFSPVSGVNAAIASAKDYLRNAQGADGGWENSFSTSWAIQAIHALGESLSSWQKNGNSPMNSLALAQQQDGGVELTSASEATRMWATAYAIPAALGKPWNDILQSFPKPVIVAASGTGGEGTVAGAATSTATTTAVISEPEENESETMSVIAETETATNPIQQQAASAPLHSSMAGASAQ